MSDFRFRVFLSSPSDVAPERDLAAVVFAGIANETQGRVQFELVRWEKEYFVASSGFQDQIVRPSTCDLVLCLFWKTLGTELPPNFDRPDGSGRTGTEYEFEEAMEAARSSGEGRPKILVYKKTAPVVFDEAKVDAQRNQKRLLDQFWERWFRNEQGHLIAAFHEFDDAATFAAQLERHVRLWLEHTIATARWDSNLLGSPFSGLQPFDAARASVFFGRQRVVDEIRARLISAKLEDAGFLMVLGASGVGKSSLVRAGLIPRLSTREALPGIGGIRSLSVRPSEIGEDWPLLLAQSLMRSDVLSELAFGDFSDPAMLGRLLSADPQSALPVLQGALGRVPEQAPGLPHGLLLVLDQFEEIFAWKPEQRASFASFLAVFARMPRCFVVATMRSDFYGYLQSDPGVLALKTAGKSYDLAPPSSADFRDIIRKPVEAAGLQFEKNAEGNDLADLIESEAIAPGALPMVQFLLDRLFVERDVERGLLLFSTYERLGGAAGALAWHGEAVLQELRPEVRDCFPELMRRLVTIGSSGAPVSLSAQISDLHVASPLRELADRLVDARLMVVREEASRQVFRVAHEALLERWPRMAEQISRERRDLETRARLDPLLSAWRSASTGEKQRRFLTGLFAAEGRDLLARWPETLTPDMRAFITASAQAEQRAQRRRNTAAWSVAAIMAALSIVSIGFGALALRNAEEADQSLALTQNVLDSASSRLTSSEYSDDAQLEPLQRGMLATLLPFYETLLKQSGSDPAATTSYARSLLNLARLKSNYESMASAEREFRTAENALWPLHDRKDLPAEYNDVLAQATLGLADQLSETGRRTDAKAVLDKSDAVLAKQQDWPVRRACALLSGDPIYRPISDSKVLAGSISQFARAKADRVPHNMNAASYASCLGAAALTLGEAGDSANPDKETDSSVLFTKAIALLDQEIARKPRSLDAQSRKSRVGIMQAQWELGRSQGDTAALDFADIFLERAAAQSESLATTLDRAAALAPSSRRVAADRAASTAVAFEISLSRGRVDEAAEFAERWMEQSIALVELDPQSEAVRDRIADRLETYIHVITSTQTPDFGLPACRKVYDGIQRLKAVQKETTAFTRQEISALQCIIRIQIAAGKKLEQEDSARIADGRAAWSRLLKDEDVSELYRLVGWRIEYLNDVAEVSPGLTPDDAIAEVQAILNQNFPTAVRFRIALAQRVVIETLRLVFAGKVDEAKARFKVCGGGELANGICASVLVSVAEQLGTNAPKPEILAELTRDAPKLKPATSFVAVDGMIEPPAPRPFGTLFKVSNAHADPGGANIVVTKIPIDGEVVFADAELESWLRLKEAGNTTSSLPRSSHADFIRSAAAAGLDPELAFMLIRDSVASAYAFGRPTDDPTRVSMATPEQLEAAAWINERKADPRISPYLKLYAEKIGKDWYDAKDWRGFNQDLAAEKGVITLRGKNINGDEIFTYLSLTLESLTRLRDVMRAKQDFSPTDFGTVIYAGRGDPPPDVEIRLALFHNMTVLQRPGGSSKPKALKPIDAILGRADAAMRQRDYPRAVTELDQAIALERSNPTLFNSRCWARALWGQELDRALSDCNTALAMKPNTSAFLDSRGLVFLRLQRFPEAFADFDAAYRSNSTLLSSLYGRGLAKKAMGRSEGQVDIDAAKAQDPSIETRFGAYTGATETWVTKELKSSGSP